MWPNPLFSADFATFAEKILNKKLHFLSGGNVIAMNHYNMSYKDKLRDKIYKYKILKQFRH